MSLFGDRLTLPLAAGGVLIVVGSFVVVYGEREIAPDSQSDLPLTPLG